MSHISPSPVPYSLTTTFSNPRFASYYLMQGICPPAQWSMFLEALTRPLPSTFRVCGNGLHIVKRMENEFAKMEVWLNCLWRLYEFFADWFG